MSNPFLGEIRMFGGNFAPYGWAFCNGQLLPIAQNTALFALLGTTYGGNGSTTFALPDLRSRMPMHAGAGANLSPRTLGEMGGEEYVTLLVNQIPAHVHSEAQNASSAAADSKSPAGAVLAVAGPHDEKIYSTHGANLNVGGTVTGVAGGGQPHDNMPPFTAVNFIIALQGIFPSRN